ncbi:TetR/AcrR family transcriptional regulator [Saccharibacillus alkalitolerans]|uniref:TetR family transcriptional regulator n=1 Tax=Saccharibacillus alkalitolerans TaxID=2705290 RepID=A0ABX0F109_9BACL|nr:TetR family transcriptional regulator [Saccharibacillus alkalitolerans]NGZ74663.1 TetR family transcriptional regulator [Saccharibacillus alkalitolerans]
MNDTIAPKAGREGLRERKKRLAEQAITDAALRLFAEKGYYETSIQEIADAVMMSSRTFFRYFDSKEDILSGAIRAVQREGLRLAAECESNEPLKIALRRVFLHLAELYQQQRDGLLARYRIAKQSSALASLFLYAMLETEPELCAALAARLEPEPDRSELRFLVALHMTALRVTIEEWLENEESPPLSSLLEQRLIF